MRFPVQAVTFDIAHFCTDVIAAVWDWQRDVLEDLVARRRYPRPVLECHHIAAFFHNLPNSKAASLLEALMV